RRPSPLPNVARRSPPPPPDQGDPQSADDVHHLRSPPASAPRCTVTSPIPSSPSITAPFVQAACERGHVAARPAAGSDLTAISQSTQPSSRPAGEASPQEDEHTSGGSASSDRGDDRLLDRVE